MGCCLGTTTKTPNPPPPPHHHPNGPNNRHFHARSFAPEPNPTQIQKPQLNPSIPSPPPPPPVVEVEEESVKEVLSETPISKPQIPKIPQEKNPISPPKPQSEPPEEEELEAEEPSQASASCGVSESYSYSTATTTTTIADARDEDEATSKRRRELGRRVNGSLSTTARRKHPYSGDLVGRRERGPRPPPRASEQPIVKRNRTETRSFRGRESGQLRNMQRGGAPTGVRRDTASSRSRSPATRNAGGVGRGALGRSPAKVTGRAGGSSSQLGVDSEANTKREEEQNDGVSKQGNESIDNPLVSLECFIFV